MAKTSSRRGETQQPVARPTISEVARAAGVDKSTVSRALRDDGAIGRETRERIRQVADLLHYVPNASARRLTNAKTDVLAFPSRVFHQNTGADPFQLELLAVITHEAASYGFDVLLSRPDEDADDASITAFGRIMGGHHADGLIVMGLRPADPRLDYLCARGYPHVLFGRSDEDLRRAQRYPYPWVEVDNRAGARTGMEHLIALGHTRIAFLGGGDDYLCGIDRHAGYRDALTAVHLPFDPQMCLPGEVSEAEGYRLARQALNLPDPPTALFAFSDSVAFGAMRAVRDAGGAVGRRFAVIGFDGLGLGDYLTPPLTTLRQPMAAIGRHLVQHLIGRVRGEPLAEPHLLLQPELIVRASTVGAT